MKKQNKSLLVSFKKFNLTTIHTIYGGIENASTQDITCTYLNKDGTYTTWKGDGRSPCDDIFDKVN